MSEKAEVRKEKAKEKDQQMDGSHVGEHTMHPNVRRERPKEKEVRRARVKDVFHKGNGIHFTLDRPRANGAHGIRTENQKRDMKRDMAKEKEV